MTEALHFRPVTRAFARALVALHHSHHAAHTVDVFPIGAFVGVEFAGLVVAGTPIAGALDDGTTWEVTRLCCMTGAPKYTASRLLGRIARVADAAGVDRIVSYTRTDERGSCYLASGYAPVAIVRAEEHAHGNRSQRWLPGLYRPTTQTVDRVRWERGERARIVGARWDGSRWEALAS